MPDISMCPGGECPKRHDCYRYRAIPNGHRQSYFTTPPYAMLPGTDDCDEFWPLSRASTLITYPDNEKD
jgi:hypothetical protein